MWHNHSVHTVFISYRRSDTAGEATALYSDLAAVIGKDSVFMDVDKIALGRDFRQVLREHLESCDFMLALVGRNWVEAKNSFGQRRLEDPGDYVRLEIETALKRNIPVTPVLVQDAQMPTVAQLPEEIKDFAYRHGFELSHNRWNSDVQEMIKRLGLSKQEKSWPTIVGASVLAMLLLGVVYYRTVVKLPEAKSPMADNKQEQAKPQEQPKADDKPEIDKRSKQKEMELASKDAISKKSESTDVKPRKEATKPRVTKDSEQPRSGGPNITTYGDNSPVTTGPNSPITINPERGWQKLADQNLANNVALLSPFAGQTVKIWIPNATENQWALVRQLKVLFEQSNWKIIDLQQTMQVGGGPRYGVKMRANSVTPALEAIAKASINLLGKENVHVEIATPRDDQLDGDYILMQVYPKTPN
jgi:hypothetical protein